MTAIASFLFTSAALMAFATIILSLGNALPRIRQIVLDVIAPEYEVPTRKITISIPVAKTAEIIALPKPATLARPAFEKFGKLAA